MPKAPKTFFSFKTIKWSPAASKSDFRLYNYWRKFYVGRKVLSFDDKLLTWIYIDSFDSAASFQVYWVGLAGQASRFLPMLFCLNFNFQFKVKVKLMQMFFLSCLSSRAFSVRRNGLVCISCSIQAALFFAYFCSNLICVNQYLTFAFFWEHAWIP